MAITPLEPVNPLIEEEVTIIAEGEVEPQPMITDNLVDQLDDDTLDEIASELIDAFEADVRSRKDYEDTIKKGMELLGLKIEDTTKPFPGACSAHHPMMIEGAVQFQSQAIKELFPSGGPVKAQIVGERTEDSVRQSNRIKEFMNYQLTETMEEYFDDFDQMLFYLPIVGSCFKKIYYDESLKRPVSKFIPITDFVISYNTTDLRTSGRYTHIIRMTQNELRKKIANGFYAEMDTDMNPEEDDSNDITQKIQDIEGITPSKNYQKDGRFTILEMHVDLDVPGYEKDFACPYIVSICKETQQVLSIRENFQEDDPDFKRIQHFVHYKFLPGFGFYGLGYVHLLGNLQKSVTTILRSLVDAGQFSNLPGGFKARGMRVEGEQPVGFGEFRDVEGYGEDIRKSIVPLPFKEPSQTLFALLGSMTQEGRRLAAITDLQVGDMNSNAPVGTTIALLEQGIKVMSSIHKRLHKAQREEFKVIARINQDFMPDYYPYRIAGDNRFIFKKDFDSNVDILPVSDPNIFSTAQRVLLAQTQLQAAAAAPQIHDMKEAYKRLYEALDVKNVDDILLPEMGAKRKDPATENYAMMYGRPVKAFAAQDHDAHIAVHQAMLSDPTMTPQSPQLAQALAGTILSHIQEHMAHKYRTLVMSQSGADLPPAPEYDKSNPGKDEQYPEMTPEMENQVAKLQAQAAMQMSQQNQQAAQQAQQQQQMADPRVQIAMQDLAIKKQEADRKVMDSQARAEARNRQLEMQEQKEAADAQIEIAKLELDKAKAESDIQLDASKIESNERRDALRARANKSLAREKTMSEIAKENMKGRE
jgi:Txe/YoeB family toxin of Txe-Axe toxin-antitoxin module